MTETMSPQHTFLYPTSRQYPVDEVCEQIVRALEARNWDVPGITVTFDTYGSGDSKYRFVHRIKTAECVVKFGRPQGNMGYYNDIGAVDLIIIPMKELHVYKDESGPTYVIYVGDDWPADKAWFNTTYKFNAKLDGEPRRYLRYKGACNCTRNQGASYEALGYLKAALTGDHEALRRMTHSHSGVRSPILVHDNDLNRDYDLEDGDEPMYRTADVFAEFTTWLNDNLLQLVLATPEAAERRDDLFVEEAIPFPAEIGPLFTFGDSRDAERVRMGQLDSSQLDPGKRYGLHGSGHRLAPWGTTGDFPDVAYDGFEWCGLGSVDSDTPINTLDIPGRYRWSDRDNYVIRLNLNRANGVYVADHAAFEDRRHELFEAIQPRDRLTDEELNDVIAARAVTIVPITEYDGSFRKPVVLINREVGLDEVELVSGPWPRS